MSTKTYTRSDIYTMLDKSIRETAIKTIDRWIARGDGCAVYENSDLGHPDIGHKKFVSFGSPAAQIETAEPPATLPDIGGQINWRYQLQGVYR